MYRLRPTAPGLCNAGAHDSRQEALSLLDTVSYLHSHGKTKDLVGYLDDIAGLLLCKRYHQYQAEAKADTWIAKLRHHRRANEWGKRSTQVHLPVFADTSVSINFGSARPADEPEVSMPVAVTSSRGQQRPKIEARGISRRSPVSVSTLTPVTGVLASAPVHIPATVISLASTPATASAPVSTSASGSTPVLTPSSTAGVTPPSSADVGALAPMREASIPGPVPATATLTVPTSTPVDVPASFSATATSSTPASTSSSSVGRSPPVTAVTMTPISTPATAPASISVSASTAPSTPPSTSSPSPLSPPTSAPTAASVPQPISRAPPAVRLSDRRKACILRTLTTAQLLAEVRRRLLEEPFDEMTDGILDLAEDVWDRVVPSTETQSMAAGHVSTHEQEDGVEGMPVTNEVATDAAVVEQELQQQEPQQQTAPLRQSHVECGICLSAYDDSEGRPGRWECTACQNRAHIECFDGWCASHAEGGRVRCVYCRADV